MQSIKSEVKDRTVPSSLLLFKCLIQFKDNKPLFFRFAGLGVVGGVGVCRFLGTPTER